MAEIGPNPKYGGENDTKEFIENLNRLPIFMTELDTTDGAGGPNMALEALQALAYEGSPYEVANNFKTQGNECFQTKQYKDAVEFYTKAIAASLKKEETDEGVAELENEVEQNQAKVEELFEHKSDPGTRIEIPDENIDKEEAARKLQIIVTACYLNRAACNLELQNYRRVLNDCAQVLKVQPNNAKAYYRSARACLAIDKIDDAHECIERGLEIEPNSSSFKDLSIKVFQRDDYLLKVEHQKAHKVVGRKMVVNF
ncbi:hypothetical protein V1512DRAFT_263263 [Lipomyces arxii]|uniref:uncharacterized protein n=1 Tax=Lipomyces arxii TaxID=56418 RepID=UPI0034CD27A6